MKQGTKICEGKASWEGPPVFIKKVRTEVEGKKNSWDFGRQTDQSVNQLSPNQYSIQLKGGDIWVWNNNSSNNKREIKIGSRLPGTHLETREAEHEKGILAKKKKREKEQAEKAGKIFTRHNRKRRGTE